MFGSGPFPLRGRLVPCARASEAQPARRDPPGVASHRLAALPGPPNPSGPPRPR